MGPVSPFRRPSGSLLHAHFHSPYYPQSNGKLERRHGSLKQECIRPTCPASVEEACQRDEPRYIGDQDVFVLQEQVIEHILSAERETDAKAAVPPTVDPIQQVVSEELKDALRRQSVDRDLAKEAIRFLGQPMGPIGRALHKKLKEAQHDWTAARDDAAFLAAISTLAAEFSKERPLSVDSAGVLTCEDLALICFEYVSA